MATATTTLAIVALSCAVGVLTTPLAAFITAVICTLITAAVVALTRATRTMNTIFTEELDTRAVAPRKRAG
jgi:hypothetical protein